MVIAAVADSATTGLAFWESLLLGVVEGITEFLPVSSTGHLTIAEKLLGLPTDDPGIVAFTAVIQIGAIFAAVLYFWSDIWRIIKAWARGLGRRNERNNPDYAFGWAIIFGSVPIAVIGLLFKDIIETGLRSMYFVAGGLILWSIVLWAADHLAAGRPVRKAAERTSIKDAILIGCMQCVSLIPGVSRSGSTIAAGLFLGYDRLVATKLSFYLGIPALVAAGGLEAVTQASAISATVGWSSTIVGIIVSFIVGYASIAWLLKYVSNHSFSVFIAYRVVIGFVIVGLIASGIITA